MWKKELSNYIISAFIVFIVLLFCLYFNGHDHKIGLKDVGCCLIFSLIMFIPLVVSKFNFRTSLIDQIEKHKNIGHFILCICFFLFLLGLSNEIIDYSADYGIAERIFITTFMILMHLRFPRR